MSNYAHPESLASTQWLADHLYDPQVKVVEVVWGDSPAFGSTAYEGGHIPGATAWDFGNDLQDQARSDILNKTGMEALLSRSGITPETTIVIYSGLNNLLATYAFWQLKIHGHKHVRLLDGDRGKWLDEKRPTTSVVPHVTSAVYHSGGPDWGLRANREDVFHSIDKPDHLLVDARSAEMYCGSDKAGTARGGHIPGAVNLAAYWEVGPNDTFKGWRVPTVNPDGTFKPAAELRALFEGMGITPDKEITTYCVRGGLSTHAWFVLTQLLGYPNVREYDRSWAEWGNLEDMPVMQ